MHAKTLSLIKTEFGRGWWVEVGDDIGIEPPENSPDEFISFIWKHLLTFFFSIVKRKSDTRSSQILTFVYL